MWGFDRGGGHGLRLRVASCPSQELAKTNRVFVSVEDGRELGATGDGEVHVELNGFVYVLRADRQVSSKSIGLNSVQRRELRLALSDEVKVAVLKSGVAAASAATMEVDFATKRKEELDIDADEMTRLVRSRLSHFVACNGQSFLVDFYGTSLLLKTASIMTTEMVQRASLSPTTEFSFVKAPQSTIRIKGSQTQRREIFRPDFNFEKMGIGGLDREFSDIFRRAFASRVFPPDTIKKLGISHVKGMLLFGPPGTGKTLIARQIGKMLNGKEPKVINGPEVLNKYVGQSEENIRNLFKDAETEYTQRGEESELHIIIFDEIDAICKQRGSTRDGTGVHDTVVNQLLSKIDGVNALNNILIIGMTNRKDMIDEALLRPGRLEVHVEISLPDEEGRQQILRIHTASMRSNNLLGDDVNLEEIASRTKNYSGAEIEGLCKSAAAFALNRHVDFRDIHKPVDASKVTVRQDDFRNALTEVTPAFGMGRDEFERALLGGFIIHGERMRRIVEAGRTFRQEVHESQGNPLMTVLIEGRPGTGKTALAAKLAVESGFPFVRMITPNQFVGYSEHAKCAALAKAFDDAHKSPFSILVLDEIERMIEYAPIGPRFTNSVLQTLLVLVKVIPPKGRRLLVLATTSSLETMEALDVRSSFNAVLTTPPMELPEVERIVDGAAEMEVLNPISSTDSGASLKTTAMKPIIFDSIEEKHMALELLKAMAVGIKKLLMVLEMAKAVKDDGSQRMHLKKLKEVLRDVN